MGGFTVASSPSTPASKDESDDGSSSDDADEDNGASSPSVDEMSTLCTYHLSLMTKRGSSFDMIVVIYIGGGLAEEIFVIGGVFIFLEGCSEVFMYFLFFLYIYLMYIGLVTI